MNIVETKQAKALAEAQGWLDAFAAALTKRDAATAAADATSVYKAR